MKKAIQGPDCTDPKLCKGDCCSIKIDVPKILAEEYIKRSYATKEDFIRSNVFSFHLRFDEKTGKCFLFDKKINGCSVHNSGIKPPQCWIYPTNFINLENSDIKCKRLTGWKIINKKKALESEKLLEYYVFLCKLEARKELKKSKRRLIENTEQLVISIKKKPPSSIAGFIDDWDRFDILPAEGLSLQMKKYCFKYKKNCSFLPNDFLECKNVCEEVAIAILNKFKENVDKIINSQEADCDGHYPLINITQYLG
jgi:Fe-S-cluster containining protein